MKKAKNARKTYIYVFRGLRTKAKVTNLQPPPPPPKTRFFVITLFMVTFATKAISIKRLFTSNLSLINP